MPQVIHTNAVTGEVTERDFTTAEKAQHKIDVSNALLATAEAEAIEVTRVATITAARQHAASLGFTEAMLSVMYPNLTP